MYPNAIAACASVQPAAKAAARHLSHASFHRSKAHAPRSKAHPCNHTTPRRDGGAKHSQPPVSPHRHTSTDVRSPDWYWYRFTHPSRKYEPCTFRRSANVGKTAKTRYHRRACLIATGFTSDKAPSSVKGSTTSVRISSVPPWTFQTISLRPVFVSRQTAGETPRAAASKRQPSRSTGFAFISGAAFKRMGLVERQPLPVAACFPRIASIASRVPSESCPAWTQAVQFPCRLCHVFGLFVDRATSSAFEPPSPGCTKPGGGGSSFLPIGRLCPLTM